MFLVFSASFRETVHFSFDPCRELHSTVWAVLNQNEGGLFIRLWGQGCTHKNGDFGAISVTDRSCTTPTLKVERDISEKFYVTLSCSVNGREDWNPLRRKWIFSCEDWDLEYQTLSANSANIAFVRDSKTERAVPPWNVTYPRNCWRKTPWLPILASWGITKVQITFKRQKKPMLIRCKFLYQR